jgi:uncharacterized protein (DUF39 family)
MKKAILISMILCGIIATPSFAMDDPGPKGIRSIEINADVTVVLGYFGSQQAFIDGDQQFREQIIIRRNGSHLVISASRNRDLKSKGVIYISAEMLLEVRINSAAYVQSSGSLQTPLLDVVINGTCEIMIANTGHLNLIASDSFDVEYRTERRQQPLASYRSNKK